MIYFFLNLLKNCKYQRKKEKTKKKNTELHIDERAYNCWTQKYCWPGPNFLVAAMAWVTYWRNEAQIGQFPTLGLDWHIEKMTAKMANNPTKLRQLNKWRPKWPVA